MDFGALLKSKLGGFIGSSISKKLAVAGVSTTVLLEGEPLYQTIVVVAWILAQAYVDAHKSG